MSRLLIEEDLSCSWRRRRIICHCSPRALVTVTSVTGLPCMGENFLYHLHLHGWEFYICQLAQSNLLLHLPSSFHQWIYSLNFCLTAPTHALYRDPPSQTSYWIELSYKPIISTTGVSNVKSFYEMSIVHRAAWGGEQDGGQDGGQSASLEI